VHSRAFRHRHTRKDFLAQLYVIKSVPSGLCPIRPRFMLVQGRQTCYPEERLQDWRDVVGCQAGCAREFLSRESDTCHAGSIQQVAVTGSETLELLRYAAFDAPGDLIAARRSKFKHLDCRRLAEPGQAICEC
jgi:hypothetical protein